MGPTLTATAREFVEVALQARTARVGRALTYTVPHDCAVQPGQIVWVPLRRGAEIGIALGRPERLPTFRTRDLWAVLSREPLVGPTQLALARWIAGRYACSIAEALTGFLPPGARSAPRLVLAVGAAEALRQQPSGRALLAAFGRQRLLALETAAAAVTPPELAALLRAGLVLARWPELGRAVSPLQPLAVPAPVSRLERAQED